MLKVVVVFPRVRKSHQDGQGQGAEPRVPNTPWTRRDCFSLRRRSTLQGKNVILVHRFVFGTFEFAFQVLSALTRLTLCPWQTE